MNFSCPHCRQDLEADADMAGQEIACPACSQPLQIPRAVRIAQPKRTNYHNVIMYKKRKKTESVGFGAAVQLIGLLVVFWFPIGTLVGLCLLVAGGRMAIKYVCTACGNKISDSDVALCPSCHVRLEGLEKQAPGALVLFAVILLAAFIFGAIGMALMP